MALIWADFPSGQRGMYDTTGSYMLNGVWAEIFSAGSTYDCLVDDPDPEIGSNGIVLTALCGTTASGANSQHVRLALPAEVTTLGLGFRMWLAKLPSDPINTPFIQFRTNTNTEILTVRLSTTGQLIIASGASVHGQGGTTLSTSNPVLTANAWNHVEIKATKGAGDGAVEIRVNGAVAVNLSSLTLSASNIAQFAFGCSERASDGGPGAGGDGAMIAYWKDLIVWDTSGSHVNNFQGAVFVYDLVPDGDNSLNWTPSTGATGYNLVDEDLPVDTDYISADVTQTTPTIFTMTDLPPDVVSVKAVMNIGRMIKTDGGDCNVEMALSPNGTDWDAGADRPITVANTYFWDVSHTSPDTAAAWTPDEVDDILYRVDRTL